MNTADAPGRASQSPHRREPELRATPATSPRAAPTAPPPRAARTRRRRSTNTAGQPNHVARSTRPPPLAISATRAAVTRTPLALALLAAVDEADRVRVDRDVLRRRRDRDAPAARRRQSQRRRRRDRARQHRGEQRQHGQAGRRSTMRRSPKRSTSGDHRTFSVHGRPSSESRPISVSDDAAAP